ncbi:hypothetical protein LX36DRAFT_381590 [Colletotrichum falcatum]|nr:hypothetical protein LX36DRAFT_381590 [Colletotrichum falcatum]
MIWKGRRERGGKGPGESWPCADAFLVIARRVKDRVGAWWCVLINSVREIGRSESLISQLRIPTKVFVDTYSSESERLCKRARNGGRAVPAWEDPPPLFPPKVNRNQIEANLRSRPGEAPGSDMGPTSGLVWVMTSRESPSVTSRPLSHPQHQKRPSVFGSKYRHVPQTPHARALVWLCTPTPHHTTPRLTTPPRPRSHSWTGAHHVRVPSTPEIAPEIVRMLPRSSCQPCRSGARGSLLPCAGVSEYGATRVRAN